MKNPRFDPGDRVIYASTNSTIERSDYGDWLAVCPDDDVAMDEFADDGYLACPVCHRRAIDV